MTALPSGLHPVPTRFGCFHVLVHAGRAVVIDTGLFGGQRRLQSLFHQLGIGPRDVDAILLTHGHLDHAGNAAWLQAWSHAPIVAHPAEQRHLDGSYPYRRLARWCGIMEGLGRRIAHYRPVRIDHALADNEQLPWWGGLRVVHLPGHTAGHCGFWSERHRLLFCGDLVAIWKWWSEFPPAVFNTDGRLLRASLHRAVSLEPALVVPNHYSVGAAFDPAEFARRFHVFARRKLKPVS